MMNRRNFLKGSGLAGLFGFLQACRLTSLGNKAVVEQLSTSIPTNTPMIPTETLPPTMTNTAIPTNIATATATATPTPSPKPAEINSPLSTPTDTATPAPSPTATTTPTPPPTPYPPGPPSKLGLFVTRFEPKVLEIVAQGHPALIKTLEIDGGFVKGLKESSPTTIIVARLHLDQINLDADPMPLAQDFVNKLLPIATDTKRMAGIDAWEAYNEPVADTPERMKRLADFEAERTRLLAAQGIRSVVGNFAAGHPPLELWPQFKPALEAIRQYQGYLGLHEYSAPVLQFRSGSLQLAGDPSQGDEGWLTLRYRKAYRQQLAPMGFGDIPTLITECGIDGLIRPRPGPENGKGWQDFIKIWLDNGLRNDPPGVYMDQLLWYDQNLQQDNYIKGAAIFLAGGDDPQWASYNILGPGTGRLADLLQQYLTVHQPK